MLRAQARKTVEEAETILSEPEESAAQLEKVWKLVRGSRVSAKLDAVFGGDRPDGRRIDCGEPDFVPTSSKLQATSGSSWWRSWTRAACLRPSQRAPQRLHGRVRGAEGA